MSHEKELMLLLVGEYDVGASLLLNSVSTSSATMHMEGAYLKERKALAFSFWV